MGSFSLNHHGVRGFECHPSLKLHPEISMIQNLLYLLISWNTWTCHQLFFFFFFFWVRSQNPPLDWKSFKKYHICLCQFFFSFFFTQPIPQILGGNTLVFIDLYWDLKVLNPAKPLTSKLLHGAREPTRLNDRRSDLSIRWVGGGGGAWRDITKAVRESSPRFHDPLPRSSSFPPLVTSPTSPSSPGGDGVADLTVDRLQVLTQISWPSARVKP